MQSYHPQHAAAVWAAELETIRRTDWRLVNDREAARQFGLYVERLALDILVARGHGVVAGAYAEHHDLLANGVRVEVKAARWGAHGAYRFNMRRSEAELYLLACCSEVEVLAWFCVPAAALDSQKIIGIWAKNPNDHRGQWAAYLEAWEVADRLIRRGGDWPMQPPLF
jgi:predicted DNA-binding protein (UPF0251 family)